MKLHTVPKSPNGRKVQAVIHHLGLDVETVYHDLFAGEQRKPEYLALNPNGAVPTLTDGEFVLWESNAIMQYLADKAGDDALFPRDERKRADIVRWQCWELCHFNRAFAALAFETVAKPRNNFGAPDQALIDVARKDLARYAPVLDSHLSGRKYVVGNTVTLADYSMAPFEPYTELVPFDWKPYRNVNAYFAHMRTVVAWQLAGATDPTRVTQAA